MTPTPRDAVDTVEATFGHHQGYRVLHAKGIVLTGTFTATPAAARLSRAAHLQGTPVPVTARVSNGAGDPGLPDYAPDVRGLAVKFYLPDGSRTDIMAQTAPRFPVRQPGGFLELVRVLGTPWLIPLRLPVFLARHPEALLRLPPNTPKLMPPESYAHCRYYAIHAFRFEDAQGGSRYVRYTFVPELGESRLSPAAARRRGRDYLQEDIRDRLATGPVHFTLELQVAAPGDLVDDPAAAWPESRERVDAGRLTLTGVDTEREQGDDVLVFDPGRLTDGIEPSDDPVLRYRSPAIAESVLQRSGVRWDHL
jgi:catalase